MIKKSPTEKLLIEATHTVRNLPSARLRQKVTSWPETIPSGIKAYAALPKASSYKRPLISEITRLDMILDCLMALTEQERRLLWGRASNISWKKLSEREGYSHVTLRKRYEVGHKKLERLMLKKEFTSRIE